MSPATFHGARWQVVGNALLALLLTGTAGGAQAQAQADIDETAPEPISTPLPTTPDPAANAIVLPPTPPPPFMASEVPAEAGARSPLRASIDDARKLASILINQVWELKGKNTLTPVDARAREDQINSLVALLGSFDERAIAFEKIRAEAPVAEQPKAQNELDALAKQVAAANDALAAIGTQLDLLSTASGWDLIDKLLSARCSTAICFDNGTARHWLGIEPLVELPIGIGFAVGNSSLTDYVNNHDITVDLAAGARVWLFRDWISLSVYISKPLLNTSVTQRGSDFVYPGSSVHRPFPGLALGFLFDSLWVGFDRNELRNGDGKDGSALNPDFPPNAVVSSAWTITLALQPVTAFRTAIGTAVQANKAGAK